MSNDAPVLVLCNGASPPSGEHIEWRKELVLNYLARGGVSPNVRIGLPDFVRGVYHLPDRMLDLLELAAYAYCADRLIKRGSPAAVEYQGWSRSFHFAVKVRDYGFWNQSHVSEHLSRALEFMTGDLNYRFSFQPGHATPRTSLFDDEQFHLEDPATPSIMLFSGGLDSLAGAIQRLDETDDQLCLVSHQSQPGTTRTQERLVAALRSRYPKRVSHYKFRCNLREVRAIEETQRTRAFLYTSIACAIGQAFSCDRFSVYENGVTSINFPRRQDLSNARASRTTHPQTIFRLRQFLSLVLDHPLQIDLPFLWKTKSDIIEILKSGPYPELIPSSVSCSKTFQNLGLATHCGGCSQCIDRRFAAYGSRADDWDEAGIYAKNIITGSIDDGEVRTTAVDYVRQAQKFGTWNIDHFFTEMMGELSDLIDYLPGDLDENARVEGVWTLCRRHGDQVAFAMKRMREAHDDLYARVEEDSLLKLIADRDYLKDPVDLLVSNLCHLLAPAVGTMFSTNQPKDEPDLNLKVSAVLESHRTELVREHPAVSFAGGHAIPDHGSDHIGVFVEGKYVRGATSPSRASEGMAADLTKYPEDVHILFLVYDPMRAIKNDQSFKDDFESKGRCTVLIVR